MASKTPHSLRSHNFRGQHSLGGNINQNFIQHEIDKARAKAARIKATENALKPPKVIAETVEKTPDGGESIRQIFEVRPRDPVYKAVFKDDFTCYRWIFGTCTKTSVDCNFSHSKSRYLAWIPLFFGDQRKIPSHQLSLLNASN